MRRYHIAIEISLCDIDILSDTIPTKYCKSLQVKLGLASKANAQTPAAIGALADVPVCSEVHICSGRRL